MRGLPSFALCLVACYSPTINPGVPCETECPGNLVCIDRVCRDPGSTGDPDGGMGSNSDDGMTATGDAGVDASTIDAAPVDSDGDGLLDSMDNCAAKPNADQHDEDVDSIGDVCDPCPHITGSAADADGDGVGDACDPQVSTPKQRIRFFDPFTSTRAEWEYSTGASRVGETLRINGVGYGGAILNIPTGENRIYAGGNIASVVAAAPYHQLAITFGHNAAGDVYHYHELYDAMGQANGFIAVTSANVNVYNTLVSTTYTPPLPAAAWSMRIDLSVANQRIATMSRIGSTSSTMSTMASTPPLTTGSKIQMDIHDADVRFNYFLVIETLP